ncbi:MAG TPA: hypothetical protein VFJ85_05335 [Acidimicrobiales bacterium]|nr:hypothetical protein [Acidimicrobiales bacterium]
MRKLIAAATLAVATLALAPQVASAAPADKPVVTVGRLSVSDGGGASPDTWHTSVTVPVGGYNFTPGGNVYVTFQDITAGTAALSGEWTVAGTGSCGLECNNYGKISYSRTLSFPYRSVCGHWLRTWAWDQVKSPQTGYGWSYRDVQVAC